VALSIKHPEADRLARELAATTGETLTEAVLAALRERLERQRHRRRGRKRRPLSDQLREISDRCAALPVLDRRSADEIVGYDDRGLPR